MVLLILAGVSINLLLGDNGIITKAKGAKEEYSKSSVKEKVNLLLSEHTINNSTGQNEDLAKFLRQNLQVGVAENDDNTYSFILGEYQVITDENSIISIEKFNLNTDKTYANVEHMKADTELTAGKLVRTEGYYSKTLGGGAYYDIVNTTEINVDNAKCIQLNNGLYAKLHVINSTVSVNQFGAYGDGEHDDAGAIQLALNSGYNNVSFENSRYKFASPIKLTTGNLTILGNQATLFWDESVEALWQQFYIAGTNEIHVNNIDIIELNFENGNIKVQNNGESVQLLCMYAENINILKCKFNIPEIEGNKLRRITNLWFNTEWKNINVKNCEFKNLTNSNTGGSIWLSNQTTNNYVSQNANIEGNYIEKSCHDETIAVWDGIVENVIIKNNQFNIHEEKVENPSDGNFTFGSEGGTLKGLQFCNNKIYCEAKECIITCGGATENKEININNNTITWCKLGKEISYRGMISNISDTDIKIYDNVINYKTENNEVGYLYSFAFNNENYYRNTITINSKIQSLQNLGNGLNKYDNTRFDSNTIIINDEIEYLCEGYYFCNNKIILNKGIEIINGITPSVFRYLTDIFKDIEISNNEITILHKDDWNENEIKLFLFHNIKINGHKISISQNTINAENTSNQSFIVLNEIKDVTPQTIYLNKNKYGIFKKIYNPKYTHKIIVNGIEMSFSDSLE